MPLIDLLHAARRYYDAGNTRTYSFRKEQLQKFKKSVLRHEKDLHDALQSDLKKSPEESWVTETGFLISEINNAISNLRKWMRPKRVGTNLMNLPASSFVIKEPLGVVLVIGTWNYPVQLLLNPVVGAIAAGNCVVVKPSEAASATEQVIGKIIQETFPPEYVLYVSGNGSEVVPEMMNNFRFDHVFYTGSTTVGRLIYKMAADKLVPVTLELGGKSPCLVESDANIKVAARRIAITKFSNAGQMCIAPDYVLVHSSKKDELIQNMKAALRSFFGDDPLVSYNYGKIINEKQFERLMSYMQQGEILYGGRHDVEKLFIEPTIMEPSGLDVPLMNEEIFGPILPIVSFNTTDEAKAIIRLHPNPLSFYVFTSDSAKEKAWIEQVPFGGGCVNNAAWHFTNHNLPFGGRGDSGIGRYHGKHTFDTFSHHKSIMKTPTWFDPDLKYPPFKGKLSLFKKIVR
ncbi:MAG TPA: aldehyde dehydrogenase [Chitinophagaceae bacterium]